MSWRASCMLRPTSVTSFVLLGLLFLVEVDAAKGGNSIMPVAYGTAIQPTDAAISAATHT